MTTITSDDKLRDNNKFRCTRCVPFPEFGMDIVDREYFDFFTGKNHLNVQIHTKNHLYN